METDPKLYTEMHPIVFNPQKDHNLTVTMMSQGVTMLYSFFMGKDKREERMPMNLSDVVQKVSSLTPIPLYVQYLGYYNKAGYTA